MNIVILNGSPRVKGNTRCMIDKLSEGLLQGGVNVVEMIDLSRKKLRPCMACDGCRRKNTGRCIMDDDSGDIIDKLALADVIIFATPVYFWGMSAHMKLLVDKFYSCEERLRGKTIGLLSVGEDALTSPQYRMINEQFDCISAFLGWKKLFSESVSACAPGEVAQNAAFMEKLCELGKSI